MSAAAIFASQFAQGEVQRRTPWTAQRFVRKLGAWGICLLRAQGHRLADAPPDGDVLRLMSTRVTVKSLVLLRHAQSPWNLESCYRLLGKNAPMIQPLR